MRAARRWRERQRGWHTRDGTIACPSPIGDMKAGTKPNAPCQALAYRPVLTQERARISARWAERGNEEGGVQQLELGRLDTASTRSKRERPTSVPDGCIQRRRAPLSIATA